MKWNINKEGYEPRETRIVEGFLFFPMTINGERRWLEYAKWEEHVWRIYTTGNSEKIKYEWAINRWLD